jgi:hypothetical protein
MSMVLANTKKAKLLEQKRTYLNTLTYKLFKNNITPGGANVAADFIEVTDGGYAAKTNMGFAAAYLNGVNQGQTDAPSWTNTFNFSGGAFTVYGYYVVDPADGGLVFSERAASPFNVTANGQTYTVVPSMLEDTM